MVRTSNRQPEPVSYIDDYTVGVNNNNDPLRPDETGAGEGSMARLVEEIGVGLQTSKKRSRENEKGDEENQGGPTRGKKREERVREAINRMQARMEGDEVTTADCKTAVGDNRPLAVFLNQLKEGIEEECPSSNWTISLAKAVKAIKEEKTTIRSIHQAKLCKGIGDTTASFIKDFFRLQYPHLLEGDQEVPKERTEIADANSQRAGKRSRQRKCDEGGTPEPARKKSVKPWEPKYGSGCFAILVTLHRLFLQGKKQVGRKELMDEAEGSNLATEGIYPQKNPGERTVKYQYCGWSGFNKYLRQTPRGHDAPMVHTWGQAMTIRLSDEGYELAKRLHAEAERRGDCRCNLIDGDGNQAGEHTEPSDPAIAADVENAAGVGRPVEEQLRGNAQQGAKPAPRAHTIEKGVRSGSLDGGDVDISNELVVDWEAAAPTRKPEDDIGPAPWKDKPIRVPPLGPEQRFDDRYYLVLMVDNTEGAGGESTMQSREELLGRLRQQGIKAEAGCLYKGDIVWLARERGMSGSDYVLDMVVERKRVSDMVASIHNGRWQKQRYFLERSLLRRPALLIEGDPHDPSNFDPANADRHSKAVKTALAEAEVHHGFHVLRAQSLLKSVRLLRQLTEKLQAHLSDRRPSPEDSVPPTLPEYNSHLRESEQSEDSAQMCFGKVLCCVVGVGPKDAEAVIARYPTPSSLFCAYKACPSSQDRRHMLEDLPLGRSGQRLGPTASSRVYDTLFAPAFE